MVRNVARKNIKSRNGGGLSKLMLTFVAFLFGYLSASLLDLNQLGLWVTTRVLAQQKISPPIPLRSVAALPKPKFEFYTLLANERVGRPDPAAAGVVAVTPVVIASVSHVPSIPLSSQASNSSVMPANLTVTEKLPLHAPLTIPVVETKKRAVKASDSTPFLVQIASFRNLREAERMKASLMLKGFDVSINTALQQRVTWYRVIIGPFGSRLQAQKAQLAFSRSEHIIGMIRKIDV